MGINVEKVDAEIHCNLIAKVAEEACYMRQLVRDAVETGCDVVRASQVT